MFKRRSPRGSGKVIGGRQACAGGGAGRRGRIGRLTAANGRVPYGLRDWAIAGGLWKGLAGFVWRGFGALWVGRGGRGVICQQAWFMRVSAVLSSTGEVGAVFRGARVDAERVYLISMRASAVVGSAAKVGQSGCLEGVRASERVRCGCRSTGQVGCGGSVLDDLDRLWSVPMQCSANQTARK